MNTARSDSVTGRLYEKVEVVVIDGVPSLRRTTFDGRDQPHVEWERPLTAAERDALEDRRVLDAATAAFEDPEFIATMSPREITQGVASGRIKPSLARAAGYTPPTRG